MWSQLLTASLECGGSRKLTDPIRSSCVEVAKPEVDLCRTDLYKLSSEPEIAVKVEAADRASEASMTEDFRCHSVHISYTEKPPR